jgi:hypothetical protein
MIDKPLQARLFWILRTGVFMEFIGHGVLGLGHPPSWAAYFGVVAIGHGTAWALMPPVGIFDIILGFAVLLYPVRAVVLYMALWGLWTALLRPLSGESVWEAIERAGNYGVPFCLFLLSAGGGWWNWLGFSQDEPLDGLRLKAMSWGLRLTTVLLLLGHGLLGLYVHKPLYGVQYASIGLGWSGLEPAIGAVECVLALAVLVRPCPKLLVGILVWKLASEALNPVAGSSIWVFIEHGGSYAAPLALALLDRPYDVGASRLNRGAIA